MSILGTNGKRLQRQYLVSLLFIGALLLIALVAYVWFSITGIRTDSRATVMAQSEQLKLSVDDRINLVRGHVFTMRRAVENSLARPGPANATESARLLRALGDEDAGSDRPDMPDPATASVEAGSLHVSPDTRPGPAFQRDLAAAVAILPGAAADHQWYRTFEWSYYYDAGERWFLIYPHLSTESLLRATHTADPASAIRFLFEGDGTRPVMLVGPRRNPQRHMRWTRSYNDASGKGMMVTLLAPVYLADEYVGAVGTDVTLATLDQVLLAHAPEAGRALIVDTDGTVLADQDRDSQAAAKKIPFAQLFPHADTRPRNWLSLPIEGTPWTLRVHLNDASVLRILTGEIRLYIGFAVLIVLAILNMGILQSRRYAGPALRLAGFIEDIVRDSGTRIPPVPGFWIPMFERVVQINRERRALIERTRQQAEELERKVAERTMELQQANESLQRTITDLEQTRRERVRADRLGVLGGMIAGVVSRLQEPLERAEHTASRFLTEISAFREQLGRGLRKAELEAFIAQAQTTGEQVSREIRSSTGLLGRFRQLAVDQTNEQARHFRLQEVAENVLTVIRAASRCKACEIVNNIPDTIEMHAVAGILGQVLHYLLENAIGRARQAGVVPHIIVAAGADNDERGEWILLTLSDAAPMPDEAQEELAPARLLIRNACRGELRIDTADGRTRLLLRLPQSLP